MTTFSVGLAQSTLISTEIHAADNSFTDYLLKQTESITCSGNDSKKWHKECKPLGEPAEVGCCNGVCTKWTDSSCDGTDRRPLQAVCELNTDCADTCCWRKKSICVAPLRDCIG